MFFPIGDTNVERGYKPFLTYVFIFINVAVFLFQVSLGANQQVSFVTEYGSIPAEITHGVDLYTLLTSMFLHGGWMHLIGNMLFLWVFGDNIEATVGYFQYFLFYIGGGIVAAFSHSILASSSTVPCVGASGAISACLGAYLVMFPKSQIKVLFIALFSTFRVSAIYFLGFWILQQFISGIGSISAPIADAGVAYWAHIGGFVFGVGMGLLFKKKVRS
ncbi:MAG: rhomboid family intramembrane serine protease [Chitinophagaceae bacterium]